MAKMSTLLLLLFVGSFFISPRQSLAQSTPRIPIPLPHRIPPIPTPLPGRTRPAPTIENLARYLAKLKVDARAATAIDRQIAFRQKHIARTQSIEQRLKNKRITFSQMRLPSAAQRSRGLAETDMHLTQLRANLALDQYRVWFLGRAKQTLAGDDLSSHSPAVQTLFRECAAKRLALRQSIQTMITTAQNTTDDATMRTHFANLQLRMTRKIAE